MGLGWLWWRAWAPWRRGPFAWQARHLATSAFVSRGRCGTWRHLPSFHLALMGLGWLRGPFAWQARHLVTSAFVSRVRCGTWRHLPSLHVAGVALMGLGWLWWRAWAPWRRGTFAWQARHLTMRSATRGVVLDVKAYGVACVVQQLSSDSMTPLHTPWFTHIFVRPSSHTSLSHTVLNTQHLQYTSSTHQFSHTSLPHTPFSHTHTHAHTHTHTTPLCHTQHCHTPPFTHIYVTHHFSHTTSLHATLHIQPCNSLIIHHLLCLSFHPRPTGFFWKKLTYGVIRSFNSLGFSRCIAEPQLKVKRWLQGWDVG